MRLFIQPPKAGDTPDGLALRACEILREARVFSAQPGGIINDCAVVLISESEVAESLAALKQAGMPARADP